MEYDAHGTAAQFFPEIVAACFNKSGHLYISHAGILRRVNDPAGPGQKTLQTRIWRKSLTVLRKRWRQGAIAPGGTANTPHGLLLEHSLLAGVRQRRRRTVFRDSNGGGYPSPYPSAA